MHTFTPNTMLSRLVFCLALCFGQFCFADVNSDQQHLYVATIDQIAVYKIDSETGKLQLFQTVPLPGAGPFRFSHDNSRMYSVSTEDGKLKLVHAEDCQFRAGYPDVDQTGPYIAGNNYKLGKVMLWKLDEGVYRGATLRILVQTIGGFWCPRLSPTRCL